FSYQMDEEELLLQGGDDASAVNADHLDEDQLLGDAGSTAGENTDGIKIEEHEELDYEEEEEKEERESRFTSERAKKSPILAPDDTGSAAPKNTQTVSGRGNFRGRGAAGFRGGNFNSRGGMRMAGGGSAGPISLLTSNIPPPMMMGGPMGGPMGNILVNPNFPVGAGLTLLPNPGPGYGAPPMGLRGPMGPLGPKVTLSIDGAPALAVPVNVAPPQQMGPGPGGPMMMPPPNLSMRPGGGPPMVLNPMAAPPPSAMRFPPGMGPPPMSVGMNVPPPGIAPQLAGMAPNWNLMVEAFLGDKKSAGDRTKKKRRRRSRSSSYSSSSGSESSYSSSSRSRSRSRSPRKSRKRSSRGTRKHRKERSSGERGSKGERGGERRVFRTGPNSFRINSAPTNGGAELPSLLDGMERGGSSRSRRADRERQRENDSRDSARALGLDDEYLSRVEDQRRQREELRRRRDRAEGGGGSAAAATRESVRDRREGRAPVSGRSRNESHGNGSSAAKDVKKKTEATVEEAKRKAYLAVHVKNVGHLGEAALGRVKALANEVGETKKVWRPTDDVVTVIFVELDKAKAFMLKYNGKVLSGLRVTVGLEKVYLNLSEVKDR
ncbi:hypothetical protein PMAYCL1PPCAC_11385, partial [Pristionchus mayeri]